MSSSLAVENVSQIESSNYEGCKKELALAILLNKSSAARKMQLYEALNKTQIGFAKWKVSTQATCMMPIIPMESWKFHDAACKGIMEFCGEAVAVASEVQAMEDGEQRGDEHWLPEFSQTKTMVSTRRAE